MQLAGPEPMTREQFLAWKVRRELRYEFDGFQPVAMTGGTVAHAIIRAIWPSSSVRRYIVPAQDAMASTWFESIDDDWGGHPLNADSVLRDGDRHRDRADRTVPRC